MTKERLEYIKKIRDKEGLDGTAWSYYDMLGGTSVFNHEYLHNNDTKIIDLYEPSKELKHLLRLGVEARTAIPELITAYEKAVGMLKRVEWSDYSYMFDEYSCEFCRNNKDEGHAHDCELKKILEG